MKKIFIASILLFVALLIVVYFIAPEYEKFRNLKQEISERETQVLRIENYFSNLNKVLEDLENYQDSLEKIETGLPEDFSFPSLLAFFAKKSSESGLLLKNMSIGEVQGIKGIKGEEKALSKTREAYFNLEIVGLYQSLKSFIDSVEKSSRLIEVENFSINTGKGENEEFLDYSVRIKAYSFKK